MTHGVDALQKHITQDIKGHTSTRLNATVGHAISCVSKTEILFLQGELLCTDCEAHDRKLIDSGVGRVDVSLLRRIIFTAWNRLVDSFAGFVVNKSKGCSGISDGSVAGTCDRLAGYDCRGAVEHPKALRIVNGRVVRGLAAKGLLIDIAEGVEGFAFVWIVRIFDGAEIGGEELGSLWDVVLGDHILNGSLHRVGSDSIDGSPGKTEESIATVLLELGRESLGQLDGLVLDDETAHIDDVRSHCARGRRIISVGNFPGRTRGVLERA